MERHYGEQSYHPRTLELQFWGCGSDQYVDTCKSRIAQNILFACYQDKLTAEQISLEIGVMLPYMEDDLETLCACGLLKREGKRYATNIVVFSAELVREIRKKTEPYVKRIAQTIDQYIMEMSDEIRRIDFYGAEMARNSLWWQMTSLILYRAVVLQIVNEKLVNPAGVKCLIWAIEREAAMPYAVGISNGHNDRGDYIQFMDFAVHGEMMHGYCQRHRSAIRLLLDIASQNTKGFSENDWAEVAEMIRCGYVLSDGSCVGVNMPVFTRRQYDQLLMMIEETVQCVKQSAEDIREAIDRILKNHVPLHLRRELPQMACLRLLEDGISPIVESLVKDRVLAPWSGDGMLPSTYIVLQDG